MGVSKYHGLMVRAVFSSAKEFRLGRKRTDSLPDVRERDGCWAWDGMGCEEGEGL